MMDLNKEKKTQFKALIESMKAECTAQQLQSMRALFHRAEEGTEAGDFRQTACTIGQIEELLKGAGA